VDRVQDYAVHRNGRSVAGFGLGAPSDVEAALHSIRVRLDRPPWGRGVGITTVTDSSGATRYAILIQVQRPEHVPVARLIVGDQVNTVPVLYEAVGDFRLQGDLGLGAHWSPSWVDRQTKLAAMDRLVATGRGEELVEGGGCTEAGGGIVPTQRTAREMAALLRGQAGLGAEAPKEQGEPKGPARHSPWKEAVVMSVAGAVTGWVLDEIWRAIKKRKGRR
jgi:hypothetical protein